MIQKHVLCLLAIYCAFLISLFIWPVSAQKVPSSRGQSDKKSSSGAVTDQFEEAKRHFFAGVKLLEAENYEGAKAEFEEAIALHPSTSALFNLANCYEAMHRYREAFSTFEYLERSFAGGLSRDLDLAVKRHKRNILKVAARLFVQVNLEGATIEVDDEPVGTSPMVEPFLYSPGEVTIEVSLEGYATQRKRIKLVSTETTPVVFELEAALSRLSIQVNQEGATIFVDGEVVGLSPLAGSLELAPGPHEIAVQKNGFENTAKKVAVDQNRDKVIEIALVPSENPRHAQLKDPQEQNWAQKISLLSWIGFGLTLATGAADGVLWYLAVEKGNEFKQLDDEFSNDYKDLKSGARVEREKERDDAKAEAYRYNAAAIGVGIGAGAFAVATTILIILDFKRGEEPVHDKKVTVSPLPGGIGVQF